MSIVRSPSWPMAARASSIRAPSMAAGPRTRASVPSSVIRVCDPSEPAGALAEGLADGLPDGLADGLPDGLADGLPDGLADGLPDGLADGLPDGLAAGLPDGLPDGAADGPVAGAASAGSPWASTGWKVS
jgi:hypothetical protein